MPGSGSWPGRALRALRGRLYLLLLVPAGLLALAGLPDRGPAADADAAPRQPAARSVPFEQAFASAGRAVLEEPDSALISEIQGLDVAPDGRLAVADQQTDRLRVYGPEGRLLADLGGEGEGPGELQNPLDPAFTADGHLYVVQGGGSRVTRFGPGFAYDTAWRVDVGLYPEAAEPLGNRLLVYVNRSQAGARSLRVYDPTGRPVTTFHPRRPEYREVPYWSAPARRLVAVSESHVVAGGNMLYPLVLYGRDGSLRDSIGSPPESWVQPPKPEPGALRPPNQMQKYERWRRTFTTIDEIAIYRDSLLVVAHRELDPDIVAYEEATYRADVYDIAARRKLLEDVLLPGRLVAGGRHVHLLVSTPPDPWVVERFRIRDEAAGP